MKNPINVVKGSILLGMIVFASACVVVPPHDGYHDSYHEGYYDRDHQRYYHDHSWHDCANHDEHCG
jgi:hypothetical protein